MHKGHTARFFRRGGGDAFYIVNTRDVKTVI